MRGIVATVEKMSIHYRRIIFGSVFGVILGAFWMFFYGPLREEKVAVEVDVKSLALEKEQLEKAERNFPALKMEVTNLRGRLERARNELPNQREIPNLLSAVSDKARDAGLEVHLFRPTEEVVREFYAEVPVYFSVKGSYHQVANFFDEVGKLDRIVTVSGVSISAQTGAVRAESARAERWRKAPKTQDEGGGRQTEVGCTVTTFRLLDEDEKVEKFAVRDERRAANVVLQVESHIKGSSN